MKMFFFIFKQKVGSIAFKKNVVIGPKMMFRLCIRDEFGTRTLDKPALVLKSTALQREIELRTARWRLTRKYSFLHKGCSWWTDNTGTIARLCATINDALRKYRARRLEAGLFYLDGHRKTATFTTTSHMYGDSEFLRDLWRKKRSEHATRRNNQELCNTSASVHELDRSQDTDLSSSIVVGTLKLCGMMHVLYLLLVISLALAIVYL
jgi:hypothetical protein